MVNRKSSKTFSHLGGMQIGNGQRIFEGRRNTFGPSKCRLSVKAIPILRKCYAFPLSAYSKCPLPTRITVL
jgi:hypothetical protein